MSKQWNKVFGKSHTYLFTHLFKFLQGILYVEKNSINNETKEQLVSIGHKINERGSIGRMDCILINSDNKLEGGSDKRGDNIAIGYWNNLYTSNKHIF